SYALVGVCQRIARRGQPRSFAFHLRAALLRARRKYALSGRDGRAAQDELRAAGAADPHRKRLCGLACVLRRIRRGLGRAGPRKPSQPSYARNAIRHRSARDLFHHHDRRRDEATASRQRVSIGGHLALQGTHHSRRRRARIPHVRPVSARRRALSVAAGVIHGPGVEAARPCMSASLRKPSEIAALSRTDASCQNRALWLYNRGVNEASFAELSEWLTQAGLAGTSETDILSGCCDRCIAAGLPLARAHMFVDTLDPVHEGRLFRWGYGDSPLLEYGRTSPDALAASGRAPRDVEAARVWRDSPHYKMLQTGDSFLRRRLNATAKDEFPVLADFVAAGMTDYVAIISRFAPEGVIGEMDGVYSSWATSVPDGFSDGQVAALERIAPYLALAIKSASLARMTATLMETYLGRDAGRRVLGGRIVRGIAERIDAVVWFSDLRGFTRITDTAPEHAIPLLNDYSDAIVSAIHEHGGDVLK